MLGVVERGRDVGHRPLGEGEDAVAVGGVPLGGPDGLPERAGLGRVEQRPERLEGALHGHPDVPVLGVERRHPAALGVERELLDPRRCGERGRRASTPRLAASARSAASVGSPVIVHGSPCRAGARSEASLQAAATRASRSSATGRRRARARTCPPARSRRRSPDTSPFGVQTRSTSIRFSVRVPVLSLQTTRDRPERLDGRQLADERVAGGPSAGHRAPARSSRPPAVLPGSPRPRG